VIQWSRKKSGSPKYLVNGELFDRLKSKVPPEVHAILRMPQVQVDKDSFDVHFGEQTSPLFLLGDKEKAAAQFFASSSDAIRLVEMQDRHKSNIKIRKADLKRVTKEREKLEAENLVLLPVAALHKAAVKCEKVNVQIADEKKQIVLLNDSVDAILSTQQRADILEQQSDALKKIPEPPTMQPTSALQSNIAEIEMAGQQIKAADAQLKAMTKLQQPPELQPTESLAHWVSAFEHHEQTKAINSERLEALAKLSEPPEILATVGLSNTIDLLASEQSKGADLDRRLKALEQLPEAPELQSTTALTEMIKGYQELLMRNEQQDQQYKTNNEMIAEVEAEIEHWLDENPQCPTCGGEVTKDQLLEETGGHVHA